MAWSYSTGERGRNRVRVAQDVGRSNRLFVEFRDNGRKVRQYLAHRDHERAKEQAEQLAADFRSKYSPRARLTLKSLFDIYLREVTPEKTPAKQEHDRRTAALLLRAWGEIRRPETLGLRDWNRFIVERRSGRLRPEGSTRRVRTVGDRQIGYDLKFALAVFNWAVLAGDGNGGALLERNPLKGFPVPVNVNPIRPVLTNDRYRAMLAVAKDVGPDVGLALVLARETGHRIGAISALRWSDVNLEGQLVLWRSEADKMGREHVTPLTPVAAAALRAARTHTPGIADALIFPADGLTTHSARSRWRRWWLQAERLAGLKHEPRFGWHSLRHAFATALRSQPDVDVAALGGWKSTVTLKLCYQHPELDRMRQALRQLRTESTNGEQAAELQM